MLLNVYTWTAEWLTRLKPPYTLITKKRTLKLYHLEEIKSGSCFNSSQFIYRAYVWCHYLVNVYSLSPEWRFMAEKVPMQPRSRLSRPVFHVTKSGLQKQNKKHSPAPNQSWVVTKPLLLPHSFLLFPKRTVLWVVAIWRTLPFWDCVVSGWRERGVHSKTVWRKELCAALPMTLADTFNTLWHVCATFLSLWPGLNF